MTTTRYPVTGRWTVARRAFFFCAATWVLEEGERALNRDRVRKEFGIALNKSAENYLEFLKVKKLMRAELHLTESLDKPVSYYQHVWKLTAEGRRIFDAMASRDWTYESARQKMLAHVDNRRAASAKQRGSRRLFGN